MPRPSIAIGYVRQSKADKRKREEHSEAFQIDWITRYHQSKILQYPDKWPKELKTFSDIDVSGRIWDFADRRAGKQVRQFVQKGDKLIVHKLDRLGASAEDIKRTLDWFDKQGVGVHILDLGGEPISTTSAMGRFMMAVMAEVAELRVGLIVERTKDTLDSLFASGKPHNRNPKYGYKYVMVNGEKRQVECPEIHVAAGRAINLRAQSMTWDQVVNYLNEYGPEPPDHYGKVWKNRSVERIVKYEEELRKMKECAA